MNNHNWFKLSDTKAKENIIKALNSKWTMLFVLITFTSLISSCVEGDLYDLYDEELSLNDLTVKKKTTKDVYGEASQEQCGFCCMAYIKFGNVNSQSINQVYQFARDAGVTLYRSQFPNQCIEYNFYHSSYYSKRTKSLGCWN